jgi:hypothetical protein
MPKPLDVTFDIEGLARLQRTLKEAGKDGRDLREAGQAATQVVLAEARRTVPRRTGALAKSQRRAVAKTRASVLAGRTAVPYANPIHWGWPDRGIRSTEWLSRAAVNTEHIWLPAYIRAVSKAMQQVRGV